jgi:hypothetical protein
LDGFHYLVYSFTSNFELLFATARRKPPKGGQTERTNRGEHAGAAGRVKIFRVPAMLKTTPLVCERKAT